MHHFNLVTRACLAAAFLLFVASNAALAETVAVDGHPIYYEVEGDLDSGTTPILLLHGGMMSIDTTFADLKPLLGEQRPSIAIEQQGHGHTGDRDTPITLASMRRDTLGVLDHLGATRVHVVGFSMGGMLALELAVNAPERVASLSVLSASADVKGMIPEILKMNRNPEFVPSPEVAQRMPSEADFKEMQAAFADNPGGPDAFSRLMEKLSKLMVSNWGWSDAELAGIDAPALLVIGDRDFVRPAHAVAMAETIPKARLAILPDTKHMTILDRKKWIVPMIKQRIATTAQAQ